MTRRAAAAVLPWTVGVLLARTAWSHDAGTSRGEYRVSGKFVHTVQTFASTELAVAFPEVDSDADGILSAREVEQGTRTLGAGIVNFTEIEADDSPCSARFESATLEANDAVQLRASFRCVDDFEHLTIDCGFLDRLPVGHVHLATVSLAGHQSDLVATRGMETLEIDAPTRNSRWRRWTTLAGLTVTVGIAIALAWFWRCRRSRADV